MSESLTIENIKDATSFGIALKRIRKQRKLSQAELARLLNMRQPTVSDIENGRGTLDSVFKLIGALQINLVLSTNNKVQASKVKQMLDSFEE